MTADIFDPEAFAADYISRPGGGRGEQDKLAYIAAAGRAFDRAAETACLKGLRLSPDQLTRLRERFLAELVHLHAAGR